MITNKGLLKKANIKLSQAVNLIDKVIGFDIVLLFDADIRKTKYRSLSSVKIGRSNVRNGSADWEDKLVKDAIEKASKFIEFPKGIKINGTELSLHTEKKAKKIVIENEVKPEKDAE